MKVMANPYHALDANGMLSGACPAYEKMRPTSSMPLRKHVGATVEVVEGTLEKYGSKDRPKGGMRLSRAARIAAFSDAAIEVPAKDPEAAAFYRKAIIAGSVIVADDMAKSKAALAKARADAIKKYADAYGEQPPVDKWAAQFPLDAELSKPADKKTSATTEKG
jgi:hypothetical protein